MPTAIHVLPQIKNVNKIRSRNRSNAFYIFSIKHDLQVLIVKSISLCIITYSLSLFDVLTKETVTTENRLVICKHAVKETYNRIDVHYVSFVRSMHNIGDSLTKIVNKSIMEEVPFLDNWTVQFSNEWKDLRNTKNDF